MTEQLLLQQLESPSGTGRDEPRSQISLPARTTNKRGCKPAPPFSLADMARLPAALRGTSYQIGVVGVVGDVCDVAPVDVR